MDAKQEAAAFFQCDGWWSQPWYGRQAMTGLRLAFGNGRIHGSGSDIVGPFTFEGFLSSDGIVAMRKHYVGQHDVNYVGTFDGEGVMAGEWDIAGFRGPWWIRLYRIEAAENATEIREFAPTE